MRLAALLMFLLAFVAAHAANPAVKVRPGMTREEVENALGYPSAVIVKGNRSVLFYPGRNRVVFTNDRVSFVTAGLEDFSEYSSVPVAGTPKGEARVELPRADEARPSRPAAEASRWWTLDPLDSRLVREHPWIGFASSFLLGTLILVVMLRLTFALFDLRADWLALLWPALAATAAEVAIGAFAVGVWEVRKLYHVHQLLACYVLIRVLARCVPSASRAHSAAAGVLAMFAKLIVWSGLFLTLVHRFVM